MEKIISLQNLSPESRENSPEQLSQEKIAYLGNLALQKSEFLGINDPLTHLCQYIEKGEDALTGIKIDFETDVAERLPKTPFVNHIGFEFTGDDFISLKDRVSMKKMTQTNLEVLKKVDSHQMADDEIARANLEAAEVVKLSEWYKNAPDYSYLIFESLPIGSQKIAISRIYQKQPANQLQGSFVSLYNPTIEIFNLLRQEFCPAQDYCPNEMEILEHCYDFYAPNLKNTDDFIDLYRETYDGFLSEKDGHHYNFGLAEYNTTKNDGLEKIKNQPKLSSIYMDAIQKLAACGGVVSDDLKNMNQELGFGFQFEDGAKISIDSARIFLNDIIRGVTSIIDNADTDFLKNLEDSDCRSDINYQALSFYQSQSEQSGVYYESQSCPEYSVSLKTESSSQTSFEQDALLRAFNIWESLDLFGNPKIDVCRTSNCPSHGKSKYFYDRTVVGGCGFCVECHKLLQDKKVPGAVYQERIKQSDAQESKKYSNKKSKNKKIKAA